ncbi:RNaseH domain-containing protein [Micromonospora sp. WMMD1120]|uniref:RNaseH domain-containing protein n=1 Tax=Micromonospora sp. WMMD1120 TaxID=3016106 RepID=UPI0024168B22|nr:RNaseH domain-containing protein [Micromonospora sp. WMMD1120]MDG4807230.1 RNaseH domain-containing protein [Micromonospora sp. WMMD1120]
MRERLLVGVENLLGLAGHRHRTSDESWRWRTDDFTLRVHARQVPIGGELGDGGKVLKGTTHDQAVAQRRQQVKAALDAMVANTGETARLAIIELEGKDRFKVRTTDPKFAIRLGCADARMVSQFIEPADAPKKEEEGNNHHRAEAAWEDGFRQLGIRFLPIHTVPEGIPDNLTQLAFWVVKRRDDDTNRFSLFAPIALLIRPHQKQILGKALGMTEWVSYPELLLYLAGIDASGMPRTEAEQQAELAGFIRSTIRQFGGDPTLILALGTNIRYRWPTMQNAHIAHGKIGFGEAPPQRASIYGRKLRFARVCTSDRLETAQWWAPGADDRIGFSKGLWTFDAQALSKPTVFYSTVGKSGKHTKLTVNDAKLTSHYLAPAGGNASTGAGDEAARPRVSGALKPVRRRCACRSFCILPPSPPDMLSQPRMSAPKRLRTMTSTRNWSPNS